MCDKYIIYIYLKKWFILYSNNATMSYFSVGKSVKNAYLFAQKANKFAPKAYATF